MLKLKTHSGFHDLLLKQCPVVGWQPFCLSDPDMKNIICKEPPNDYTWIQSNV